MPKRVVKPGTPTVQPNASIDLDTSSRNTYPTRFTVQTVAKVFQGTPAVLQIGLTFAGGTQVRWNPARPGCPSAWSAPYGTSFFGNQAGTKESALSSGQSQWQSYGDNSNIYLNGVKLIATFNGQMLGQQYIVITRGSPLDNQLNTRNGVDFTFAGDSFTTFAAQ